MAHYIVKSPFTGRWIDSPMMGSSSSVDDAHLYWEKDPHLLRMVRVSAENGLKLILRQVEAKQKPKRKK